VSAIRIMGNNVLGRISEGIQYEVSTLCTFPGCATKTMHLKFACYKSDDYFDEICSNNKA